MLKDEETADAVSRLLEEIQNNLFNKARKTLESNITTVETYREFKRALGEKGGFIRACWCMDSACEEKIKEDSGATIRLIPFEKEKVFAKCVYCGKEAKEIVYFARAY
jgi:prolyl-tRNA synthetase